MGPASLSKKSIRMGPAWRGFTVDGTINYLTQPIIYAVPLFKLIYPNTTTPLISCVSTHSNPGIFHEHHFEKESNSGLYNIYTIILTRFSAQLLIVIALIS